MIFNSTYPPNLERNINRREIDWFSLDEYEDVSVSKLLNTINKLSKKFKIPTEEIKFYRKNDIETDEFGHTEDRLIFYCERPDTEEEHKDKIEKLQLKDLQDSITEVQRFYTNVRQKKELADLYNKLVIGGKYKGLKNDVFEKFLSEESPEEKEQKSFDKGFKLGQDKVKELKKKIKEIQ